MTLRQVKLPLQYQAALSIGIAMLLVVVVTVYAVRMLDKQETRRVLEGRAEEVISQFLVTTENDAISIGNRGKLHESTLAAVGSMPDLAYLRITNRSGRVIAEAGMQLDAEDNPIILERDYIIAGETFATVMMEWSPQRWASRANVISQRTALIVGGGMLILGLLTLIALHRIAIRPIDMIEKRLVSRGPDGEISPLELDGAPELVRLNQAIDQLDDEHSQRLELEGRLRQGQKMEAVGRLAGGIAHNFNNVLMVVLGYSELLRSRIGEDPKCDKALEAIDQSVKHASSLTSQLLSLSRQKGHRTDTVDTCKVLNNMTSLLEPTLGANIEIVLDCNEGKQEITVDVALLESAILNLAANARDAMDGGGTLLIRCYSAPVGACRRASIDPSNGAVVIEVSDDGTGIPDEVQERLFDPFFTTKEPDKGTGLGLSTVMAFVEQSGGIIEVRSALGIGTIFTIILPRAAQASTRPRKQLLSEVRGLDSRSILFVEDDPSVRLLITDQLKMLGHHVVPVCDGDEAESVFGSQNGFDLLITDVGLPGSSGPEVAQSIRERCSDLPVLFITGHVDEGAQEILMSIDNSLMLRKPFSVDDLSSCILKVMESSTGKTSPTHERHLSTPRLLF